MQTQVVTLDVLKPIGTTVDLSDSFNARVGDKMTPFQLFITEGGVAKDLKGMHPELEAEVGNGALRNGVAVMAAGAKGVHWVGSTNNVTGYNQLTLAFPAEVFPQSGFCYGHLILANDADVRETSVDIWFQVLDGTPLMGLVADHYDSELQLELAKAKNANDQFSQEMRDTYNQQVADAQNALTRATANLSSLAGTAGNINAQIAAQDIITRPEYNQLANKIDDTLSKMNLKPEYYADLNAVQAKYPNGSDGFIVTSDGYLALYQNGQWTKGPLFQAAGIEQSLLDKINYGAVDGNLLGDGKLTNAQRSAWPFTSDTVLSVVPHLDQKWLQISSAGNSPYRGAGWTIAKFDDDMFDYQAKVKFKIRSTITQNLALNIQYLTADNKQLATQSIDSLSLVGTNIYDYEQIFDFDHSLASQTDHVNLSLVTNETGDIGNILLTDIYFGLCFNQAKSDNSLIEGGPLNAQRFTSDTNLNIVRYLNRNWLQITSTGNSPYRGARWIINNNSNNDLFNYLLHIKMTIYSSLTQSMSLNITYDDSQGNILQTDSISGIDLAAGSLTEYDHYYRLSYSDPSKIASIGIALVTNGTDDLGEIRVSGIDVDFDHPTMDTSLLEKNTNGTTPAWKFTSDTQLGMAYYMNDYWLKITSIGNSPYRGAGWTILKSSNELFDHPLELTLRLRSSIDQSLDLNIQYAAADGSLLDTLSVAGINLKADRIVEKSYNVQLNYADPDKVKQINIALVTNGTDDIGEIWVSHLSAKPIFTDTVDDDNKKKINSISKLPIMNLTGSLNGISGDKYVTLQFDYQDGSRTVKGYASTKWQGNSSVGMPKKAYRIKTFSDDKMSKKLKFKPCAEWEADSKWNLKAYYTDPLIGRDATNAKIGGAIWATERSLPQQLVETNNFGFVDEFPILLYINGGFAGVYSFNIAKGDYGEDATVISGTAYSDTTQYKSVPADGVKLDGSDFEMISPDTATDDIKKSVNDLLTFIATSSDTDFKAHFDEHLDKTSVIDYLIFSNLIDNSDAWGKNQTLITFDNQKWFFHPYDLDVSFGGEWNGSIRKLPTAVTTGGNRLFDRVSSLFLNDIKSRYTSLRSWLTPAYVINQYHNLVSSVGEDNYEQEYALWNNPNFEQNDFNFVKSRIMTQFKLCDKAWLN
ncbi:CotH kinase family protein [Limosilactobacillus reuteri]|uniref:CotH kinase family protein n=1 Tax=Limosilactobacillus reuteri TaxID=1598 RepID=UPI001E581AB7|nr:CotH kinase family protein [Limosilactobacillus reuteri]MCC4331820.1 CotH kinase family protein [Limosilactobacillus reuteri]MCC4354258.1 CotH kinase family protein [Limosilactobacillus reuteri]